MNESSSHYQNRSFGDFLISSVSTGLAVDNSAGSAEKDSGLGYRTQIVDYFTHLNVSPMAGAITGYQLIEWCNKTGTHCERKAMRKLLPRGVKWDKLSVDDCCNLVDAYEQSTKEKALEIIQDRKMNGTSESASDAGVAAEHNPQVQRSKYDVHLSAVDYAKYKFGFRSPYQLLARYDPKMYQRVMDSESADPPDRDEMTRSAILEQAEERDEEYIERFNFSLDPNALKVTHRTILFVSTGCVYFVMTLGILIFMSVLWSSTTRQRESELIENLASSFYLLGAGFEEQHLTDYRAELLDAVVTDTNWILKQWEQFREGGASRVSAEHHQMSTLLGALAATSFIESVGLFVDGLSAVVELGRLDSSSGVTMNIPTVISMIEAAGEELRQSTQNEMDMGYRIALMHSSSSTSGAAPFSTTEYLMDQVRPHGVGGTMAGLDARSSFCSAGSAAGWDPISPSSDGIEVGIWILCNSSGTPIFEVVPVPDTTSAMASLTTKLSRFLADSHEAANVTAALVLRAGLPTRGLQLCAETPLVFHYGYQQGRLVAAVNQMISEGKALREELKDRSSAAAETAWQRYTQGVDNLSYVGAQQEVLTNFSAFAEVEFELEVVDSLAHRSASSWLGGGASAELAAGVRKSDTMRWLVPEASMCVDSAYDAAVQCSLTADQLLRWYQQDVTDLLRNPAVVAAFGTSGGITHLTVENLSALADSEFSSITTFLPEAHLMFSSVLPREGLASLFRAHQVLAMNSLNAHRRATVGDRESTFAVETAIFDAMVKRYGAVLMDGDAGTSRVGQKIFQLSKMSLADQCEWDCHREREAINSFQEALATKSTGTKLSVNYQPVPVLAGFGFIGNGVNMALVEEVSLESVNRGGLDILVTLFNQLNTFSNNNGFEVEVRLARYLGTPVSSTHDAEEPCASSDVCFEGANDTVLYRSSCSACVPESKNPLVMSRSYVRYLTLLANPVNSEYRISQQQLDGAGIRGVNTAFVSNDPLGLEAARWASAQRGGAVFTTRDLTDHSGNEVLASISTLVGFNTAIIVTVPAGAAQRTIANPIGIGVAINVAVVLAALLCVMGVTNFVYNKVEREDRLQREELELHKGKFSSTVETAVPPFIKQKLMAGHRLISQYHPHVAISFCDIVKFTDFTRGWTPKQTISFNKYYAHVHAEVAKRFTVTILRVYGDTVVAVAGLDVHYGGTAAIESSSKGNCALNVARYAEIIMQVFSEKYRHNPAELPQFSTVLNDDYEFQNPAMRIGLHFGPVASGTLQRTGVPRYEVYGASMGIANRMQITSLKNRVHCTIQFKDILHSVDYNDIFEFEQPRKTVVRGQSTITSFLIYSVHFPMPFELLSHLRISVATQRYVFGEVVKSDKELHDSSTSNSRVSDSNTSSSSRSGKRKISYMSLSSKSSGADSPSRRKRSPSSTASSARGSAVTGGSGKGSK